MSWWSQQNVSCEHVTGCTCGQHQPLKIIHCLYIWIKTVQGGDCSPKTLWLLRKSEGRSFQMFSTQIKKKNFATLECKHLPTIWKLLFMEIFVWFMVTFSWEGRGRTRWRRMTKRKWHINRNSRHRKETILKLPLPSVEGVRQSAA